MKLIAKKKYKRHMLGSYKRAICELFCKDRYFGDKKKKSLKRRNRLNVSKIVFMCVNEFTY